MKESGIDWIGQIPEEWRVTKLKYALLISNGKDYKDIEVEEGGYPVIGSGGVFARARNYMYDGDVVLLGRKGTIDKPLFYSGKFWTVDTMFYSTALNGNNIKFMYYSSLLIPFSYYSTATALPSMTQSDLNNHVLCLPSISEQQKIADFLDKKTAQLDKVKSLLEEQIQKLKDYRDSLIYETVTKGLDKTAPMKDSGIDWIGRVPEGWGVRRLKYLVEISTGTSNTQDRSVESEGYPFFVRSQNVEKLPTYTHDTEAILTAGDGVGVGKVFHYYKGKFTAHQRVYILSNFKNIESKFLFYYVSINLKNEVSLGGAKSTVDSIRMPMLSNFMVSIPSSTEQHNISNYLDCEIKRIQAMIEIKQNQIENIDKQRQTLIYDYVTGKRRV